MDRRIKKIEAAAQQNQEEQDNQDELDYDSGDVMIEFIKVECGRNPDADPFISSVDIQDEEILNEQEFQQVQYKRTRRHKPFHKTKLNYGDSSRRDRKVLSGRERAKPVSLKTKSVKPPDTATTFTDETTADQSLKRLFTRTEQRLFNMETSLVEMHSKLDTLSDQFQSILENANSPPLKERTFIDIGFEKINNLEQLEAFNENLAQPEYEKKILQWLEDNIIDERSDYRMTEAMNMLFTRKFLTGCSWTGISKGRQKIAMMQMTHVTKLFERIGTTLTFIVNHKRVAMFFMKKLKNAGKRALAEDGRTTTSNFSLVETKELQPSSCDALQPPISKDEHWHC